MGKKVIVQKNEENNYSVGIESDGEVKWIEENIKEEIHANAIAKIYWKEYKMEYKFSEQKEVETAE